MPALLNKLHYLSAFFKNNYTHFKKPEGFTILELLIVISIIGIIFIVAIPGFNYFSREQGLRDEAKKIESNIRLAQNNALSGLNLCPDGYINEGWFIRFDSARSYTIGPECAVGIEDNATTLPTPPLTSFSTGDEISILGIRCGTQYSNPPSVNAKILFRNVSGAVEISDMLEGCENASYAVITLRSTSDVEVILERSGVTSVQAVQ
jgi:prepilin-type N-terminal cleavage/methylation domain-containing protein